MSQQLGKPVADFTLRLLADGSEHTLLEYMGGKKGALAVFWSGVCTHCVRYDEYFNSFAGLHPELGFVAIASRHGETTEQMRAAVEQRRLRFPILLDPAGEIAARWNAQQTPRCYLVAGDRTLIYRGAIDNFKARGDSEYVAYLEPAIASFAAGEPVARPETASFGCAIQTVYYQLPRQL
jgi:hypothetical protein